MPQPTQFRFRAFLSYSHRDRTWCEWLHKRLEAYRVPKPLVGLERNAGPVPGSLRPIFRDREDFSAGHSLTEQSAQALEGSQFLVVLCSPNAARSAYVNEEIRQFKLLGRAAQVLAVIIDGNPAEGEDDCFPPALRFKISPDGSLSREREAPIAADTRLAGDGKDLALLKIVAGLLGVPLGELRNREELARRKRRRMWIGIAAGFAGLAFLTTGSAVFAYNKMLESDERLDQAVEFAYGFVNEAVQLSNKAGIPFDVTTALLRRAEQALDSLIAAGKRSPLLRYRKAQMELNFALRYRSLGDTDAARGRAEQGNASLLELTRERPDVLGWQADLAASYFIVGSMLQAEGLLPSALEKYRLGLATAERLVGLDPERADWQKELSRLRIAVGDALSLQGNLEGALQQYRADFDNRRDRLENLRGAAQRSSEATLSDAEYELAVAHERLGDTLRRQGKPGEAVEQLRAGLAILDGLVGRDPEQTLWQSAIVNLSIDLGDALWYLRELDGAAASYQRAFEVAERLGTAQPKDVRPKTWAATAQTRIGDVLHARGQFDAALDRYRAALKVRQTLATSDPNNSDRQFELSESHESIARSLTAKKDYAGALGEYQKRQEILSRLIGKDRSNVGWQQNLSHNFSQIAQLHADQGRLEDALKAAREALRIAIEIASRDHSNVELKRNVKIMRVMLGKLNIANNDLGAALAEYQSALPIAQELAGDPANADAQLELVRLHNLIGDVFKAQKKAAEAFQSYYKAGEIVVRLAEAEPAKVDLQREQARCFRNVAWMLWILGKDADALALLGEGRKRLVATQQTIDDAAALDNELAAFDEISKRVQEASTK